MKTLLLIIGLNGTAMLAQAQYSLVWSTIDGGGGTSTGGVYSVAGTIGQADAGRMSGGNFTLDGGFWGVIAAIQTPGAPLLTITLNPERSTISVSWPLPAEGWVLEQTPALTGAVMSWSLVPANQYQTNSTHCFITVPAQVGTRFYRVRQP